MFGSLHKRLFSLWQSLLTTVFVYCLYFLWELISQQKSEKREGLSKVLLIFHSNWNESELKRLKSTQNQIFKHQNFFAWFISIENRCPSRHQGIINISLSIHVSENINQGLKPRMKGRKSLQGVFKNRFLSNEKISLKVTFPSSRLLRSFPWNSSLFQTLFQENDKHQREREREREKLSHASLFRCLFPSRRRFHLSKLEVNVHLNVIVFIFSDPAFFRNGNWEKNNRITHAMNYATGLWTCLSLCLDSSWVPQSLVNQRLSETTWHQYWEDEGGRDNAL